MTQVSFSVNKEIQVTDSTGESMTLTADGNMIIVDENDETISGSQVTKEEATALAIALG